MSAKSINYTCGYIVSCKRKMSAKLLKYSILDIIIHVKYQKPPESLSMTIPIKQNVSKMWKTECKYFIWGDFLTETKHPKVLLSSYLLTTYLIFCNWIISTRYAWIAFGMVLGKLVCNVTSRLSFSYNFAGLRPAKL